MPTRLAIAATVSPWSPLTTRMRMPASWQRATASATVGSGRIEHRHEPEEAEVALGDVAVGRRGAVARRVCAAASTRRPCAA